MGHLHSTEPSVKHPVSTKDQAAEFVRELHLEQQLQLLVLLDAAELPSMRASELRDTVALQLRDRLVELRGASPPEPAATPTPAPTRRLSAPAPAAQRPEPPQAPPRAYDVPDGALLCPHCDKPCKNGTGLSAHLRANHPGAVFERPKDESPAEDDLEDFTDDPDRPDATEPYWWDHALDVGCPECHAITGQRCRTPNGATHDTLHRARRLRRNRRLAAGIR